MITFDGGTVTSFSRKQIVNAKSSTEAELIGVDEALPHLLQIWYILEEQDYAVKKQHTLPKQQKC